MEIRKTMDTGTLIDLIAAGLPNFIVDKVDSEIVQTTEELCNEIGKLEHLIKKKPTNTKMFKNNNQKKMPCNICKTKGKRTRFHQEEKCWFKDERIVEKIELLNFENFEDPKNLKIHH